MSVHGIVVEDGCYGIRKGTRFHPLSNCTFRLVKPVKAGSLSGYLATATHKDGTEREFYYPKASMPKTKVEDFVEVLNIGKGGDFFRRFSIQMSSNQLDALLSEMENDIQFPEKILKAVAVVGKNVDLSDGTAIWALNSNTFLDADGNLTDPEEHGFVWISHLVRDPGMDVANQERSANVHQPLSSTHFDLICHFLKGSLSKAVENDALLSLAFEYVINGTPLSDVSLAEMEPGKESNFLPTFFTASMSLIMANYEVWQNVAGSCPIPASVGEPDSGKSTACKVALALTGGWKHHFFTTVSEKMSNKIASQTTMGFLFDDPTKGQDLGDAAKRFFNEGTSINCHGGSSPRCCPLFSINHHVMDWLLKPDRARMLARVIFIPFKTEVRDIAEENETIWHQLFKRLLVFISSTVGEVTRFGQWLTTTEGKETFNECLGIVIKGFGENGKGTRLAKMWACGLMAARKMQELTTAVNDEEVIKFFMEEVAPHVLRFQQPLLHQNPGKSPHTSAIAAEGRAEFISRLSSKLVTVVEGSSKEKAQQFLRTDCTSSKLSARGEQEGVIAIRAEVFQEKCSEKQLTPMKASDLRTSVQAFGVGLKTTEQRFYSPTSKKRKQKSCVFVKRSLFKRETLNALDEATGITTADVGEEDMAIIGSEITEPCSSQTKDATSASNNEKIIEQQKEKISALEEEVKNLKQENSDLKEKLSKQQEEMTNLRMPQRDESSSDNATVAKVAEKDPQASEVAPPVLPQIPPRREKKE